MMESKRLKNLIIKTSILSTILISLCGCFELGEYESDEEYFECFPNVELIDLNKDKQTYSVEEYFYTEEGVNDFKCDIDAKEYLYLAVQVKKDLLIDEVNLSFCCPIDCALNVSVFIVDTLPSKIRGYDDPANDEEENPIEYDDPTEVFASKYVYLSAGEWNSTYLINQSRNDLISVNKDQYILLRFENNTWLAKENGEPSVAFKTTNLLIRAQGS